MSNFAQIVFCPMATFGRLILRWCYTAIQSAHIFYNAFRYMQMVIDFIFTARYPPARIVIIDSSGGTYLHIT